MQEVFEGLKKICDVLAKNLRRRIIPAGLLSFWQPGQQRMNTFPAHPIPRPARRRSRDAPASRGLGRIAPAGVQRAAPSGARRIGAGVQRAAPSGARRIGAGVQRAAPFGARRIGAGVQRAAPFGARGCRAAPCRYPRRTPPRQGVRIISRLFEKTVN